MKIKFTKMHGLGNDFIVIDAVTQTVNFSPKQIRELSNRHTGIGFDQCLMIESSNIGDVDFIYKIYNANGQEVGQCGNGARCVARLIKHIGLSDKNKITIATKTSKMQLLINQDNSVTVNLGIPKFNPVDIPIQSEFKQSNYEVNLLDSNFNFHAISVGNPHAVIVVDDINNYPVASVGKALSEHNIFPEQANVGFMELVDADHIRLRVYERGCGETLACGSGAVAAAAIAHCFYKLDKKIIVSLPGGDLIIEWDGVNENIYLTGPATFVYEGYLTLGHESGVLTIAPRR